MERAEARSMELEALNKRLDFVVREQRATIETLEEALNGAHRVIRHLRDGDSVLPKEPGSVDFGHAGQVAG